VDSTTEILREAKFQLEEEGPTGIQDPNADVCNETGVSKALMSGSFAGLRPDLTVNVFTIRRLSAQSSNILMKMLRANP
jgi:hypothetical protein